MDEDLIDGRHRQGDGEDAFCDSAHERAARAYVHGMLSALDAEVRICSSESCLVIPVPPEECEIEVDAADEWDGDACAASGVVSAEQSSEGADAAGIGEPACASRPYARFMVASESGWETSVCELVENGHASFAVAVARMPLASASAAGFSGESALDEGDGDSLCFAPRSHAVLQGASSNAAGSDALGKRAASDAPSAHDAADAQPASTVPIALEASEIPHATYEFESISVEVAIDDVPCADMRVMRGKEQDYLYSSDAMTDSYARWSFLANEGDDAATFVECVREESRVYPRPMKATSLENEPFSFSAEHVAELFSQAGSLEECADIKTVQASNGDIYYYSSDYLSPRRAQKLAEYNSVLRFDKP